MTILLSAYYCPEQSSNIATEAVQDLQFISSTSELSAEAAKKLMLQTKCLIANKDN